MDHELTTNKGSGIFLECLDVSAELFCKAENLKFLTDCLPLNPIFTIIYID